MMVISEAVLTLVMGQGLVVILKLLFIFWNRFLLVYINNKKQLHRLELLNLLKTHSKSLVSL